MKAAVMADSLVKTYGSRKEATQALKGLSFEVAPGELFGLIGPDGAGKTTLFRILTTLLLADSGQARVEGYDVVRDYRHIRQRVGYMPGRFSLYPDLTVAENLAFFAAIFHTSIKENFDLVRDIYAQIEPFRDRRAGKLSGGMKQKLALCCALIHRPSVLFLDEPTTGVDAVSRKEFWDMLQGLKSQGITILVSTPYMDEASLCDRVALMQAGRILSINTPAGITGQFGKPLVALKAADMYLLLQDLQAWAGLQDSYPFGEYHHAVLRPGVSPQQLQDYLQQKGHAALNLRTVSPQVEDCFIALMKSAG